DSHGIGLVPQYVENVRGGHAIPNRELRIVRDAGALVALDGGKGFGQAIGEKAMALAIERAREHGCAMVGLANTHHLGRIGQWGEQCALAGMVSVHFVNVRSRPLVAPWGGTDARVSTNPFCVAVPHSPHPKARPSRSRCRASPSAASRRSAAATAFRCRRARTSSWSPRPPASASAHRDDSGEPSMSKAFASHADVEEKKISFDKLSDHA